MFKFLRLFNIKRTIWLEEEKERCDDLIKSLITVCDAQTRLYDATVHNDPTEVKQQLHEAVIEAKLNAGW